MARAAARRLPTPGATLRSALEKENTMATRRTFLASAVLVLGLLAVVQAADVTGKWTAKFATQVGDQEYTYEFVQKGTTLTGTATGSLTGKSQIAEGKVDGDKISFIENATYMDMPLRFEYTGTVTSNDEIKLSRKLMDFAAEDLVAKRSK
jgi:hypothetical protein